MVRMRVGLSWASVDCQGSMFGDKQLTLDLSDARVALLFIPELGSYEFIAASELCRVGDVLDHYSPAGVRGGSRAARLVRRDAVVVHIREMKQ